MPDTNCPHPLSKRDASALIGVLANLEGLVWTTGVDDHAVQKLLTRLESDGIAAPPGDSTEVRYNLRQALNDLNQQLRYALGEYDSPHNSAPVPR
ncbi:hypothetical protein [Cryobacterium arcticum]|uniref:Uncharacterized protein n=1 Tax=Cryobacterium arcticum TaxID=670052 RepID=A0A317ZT25_9MICO|nr:hypothetical protein [Cryobacterium arcticum]PXA68263.1 hypothetical protein CTB96_16715 [Cryobacterium arcticum]